MKTCFKCGIEKPLSGFYNHIKMPDGHLNKCKECTKQQAIEHRIANIDRYKEYDRARSNNPERVAARKAYQESKQGKLSANKAKRSYCERNAEKRKAHHKLNNALRDGKIYKLHCFVCGNEKTEAHHVHYDLPLDVVWLCDSHHKQVHKEAREYFRNHKGKP
jgi:hypothetical protein